MAPLTGLEITLGVGKSKPLKNPQIAFTNCLILSVASEVWYSEMAFEAHFVKSLGLKPTAPAPAMALKSSVTSSLLRIS